MKVRALCLLFGFCLSILVLPARAQDASAFLGRWESRSQFGLALELMPDGTGVAYQTEDDSFPLTWSVDTAADPLRLELTINGQTRVSLVRFDGEDSLTLTEPRQEAPDGFEDVPLMLLDRVDGG